MQHKMNVRDEEGVKATPAIFYEKALRALFWQSFALCGGVVVGRATFCRFEHALSRMLTASMLMLLKTPFWNALIAEVSIEQLQGDWGNEGPTLELINLSIFDNLRMRSW